jgi:lambda family phage minor tail protein L
MTLAADVQSLSPGSQVELFVLDLMTGDPQDIYRFHAGTNELRADVVWQGYSYTPWPVEASGFKRSGQGTLPRPQLRVANINGLIGSLAKQHDDLIGTRVTRKRTFVKYLDAINFAAGNPGADPNVHWPDELWFVARRGPTGPIFVEFELACPWDVEGIKLPRRQVIQNVCPWRYRSAECGYTGGAVADINDVATGDMALDRCGKRLASCKLRFGEVAELPYGGFPAAGLIR